MINNASKWIIDCTDKIPESNNIKTVLDLACGSGRNSILFSNKNYKIIAVDINSKYLNSFNGNNIYRILADIEDVAKWPFIEKSFDIIIVVNFLNRKIFKNIFKSLKKDGYLIYETFGEGQEKIGKPKNKEFLLKKNELLKISKELKLIAYEEVKVFSQEINYIKHRIMCKNVQHKNL